MLDEYKTLNIVRILNIENHNISPRELFSRYSKNGLFTLEKVVPYPACLQDFIVSPDVNLRLLDVLGFPIKNPSEDYFVRGSLSEVPITPSELDELIKAIQLYKSVGYFDKTDFMKRAWGSYSDALHAALPNFEEFPDRIEFYTVYDSPKQALLLLSKDWPDITFEVKYAGLSPNQPCGIYVVQDGAILYQDHIPYDIELQPQEFQRTWNHFILKVYNAVDCRHELGFNEFFDYIGR